MSTQDNQETEIVHNKARIILKRMPPTNHPPKNNKLDYIFHESNLRIYGAIPMSIRIDSSHYPQLALICTVCILAVSAVYIESTLISQYHESSERKGLTDSLDDLLQYGGIITYGTTSSFTVAENKVIPSKTDYYDSNSYASTSSGTYGYKINITSSLLIIEWKSWVDSALYESSHNPHYHHTISIRDNTISIPIDSIRSISVSHTSTK